MDVPGGAREAGPPRCHQQQPLNPRLQSRRGSWALFSLRSFIRCQLSATQTWTKRTLMDEQHKTTTKGRKPKNSLTMAETREL